MLFSKLDIICHFLYIGECRNFPLKIINLHSKTAPVLTLIQMDQMRCKDAFNVEKLEINKGRSSFSHTPF